MPLQLLKRFDRSIALEKEDLKGFYTWFAGRRFRNDNKHDRISSDRPWTMMIDTKGGKGIVHDRTSLGRMHLISTHLALHVRASKRSCR